MYQRMLPLPNHQQVRASCDKKHFAHWLYTGWISEIWKEVQAKILEEPLLLVKQMIPQQKALDLSFIWHPKSGRGITMELPRPPAL